MDPERRQLNRAQKMLLLILLGEFIVCLIIWRRVHFGHITQGVLLAWFITEFGTALLLRLLQLIRGLLIVFGVTAAAVAADLVNIVFDISTDPTTHNLFPLEFGISLGLAAAAAVIGVGLGSTFRPGIEYEDDED